MNAKRWSTLALAALLAGCNGRVMGERGAGGSNGNGGSTQSGGRSSQGTGGYAQGGSPPTGSGGWADGGSPPTGSGGWADGGSPPSGSSGGSAPSGACPAGCTGTCTVSGRCLVTLGKAPGVYFDLAARAGNVYWDERMPASGAVMKLPASGGAPITLASIAKGRVSGLAVDGSDVYWGTAVWENNSPVKGSGTLEKTPLDGGPAVKVTGGLSDPMSIRVDTQRAYCIDTFGVSNIVAAPLAGGAATVLAYGVYNELQDLAVDSSGVYWTQSAGSGHGSVIKLLAGGQQISLATTPADVIALGGANVYWLDIDGGTVMQVEKSGGPPMTLATGQSPGLSPRFIAADASSVYWSNMMAAGGAVMKASAGSPGAEQLAAGQWGVGGLAVDATSVYFMATSGSGVATLMKLTPK